MICAYIDEAGNTGKKLDDASQPYHYVGALLIKEEHWKPIKYEIDQIVSVVAGKYSLPEDLELHGSELFQGKKVWKPLENSLSERMSIYKACIGLLPKYDLSIVYGRCDKRLLSKRYAKPNHPHYLASLLCLERIASYINGHEGLGFIFADKCQSSLETIISNCLSDYKKYGAPFGVSVDMSNIISYVNFLESKDSRHIQLCDLSLFAIQRQLLRGDFTDIYNIVKPRVCDHNTFPY